VLQRLKDGKAVETAEYLTEWWNKKTVAGLNLVLSSFDREWEMMGEKWH